MTYLDLLTKLREMSDEQLNRDVRIEIDQPLIQRSIYIYFTIEEIEGNTVLLLRY